jgi:UDP-GlcNAc:undecaprenyl-phosphate GlcNAc-1-phosphate transferase
MIGYVLCALAAFFVSCAMMPIAAWLSRRFGAMSEVGGRHVGGEPIGRLGGLAALAGTVFGWVLYAYFEPSIVVEARAEIDRLLGITIGLVLVAGVGFWDDISRLPATIKMFVQIVSAFIAYSCGLNIAGVELPLVGPIQLGFLSLPVTLLWLVGIVNAVNLIDGLDGLAGGVLVFASLANFVAGVCMDASLPAVLMASMCGSLLAFLLYNWHPAKIYLGDGGAYSFGFILAVSGLVAPVQKASTGIGLLVPVLAAGFPIFETLLTMVRRFTNHKGMFVPDRGHLHHILLDAGIGHRRVVVGLYALSAVLCSIALFMVLKKARLIGVVLILMSIFACVFWGVSVRRQLRNLFDSVVQRLLSRNL